MIRNNPQIWRIAEYIYDVSCDVFEMEIDWSDIPPDDYVRHLCYDKALELQRKIINNEFTGPEGHKD